MGINTAIVTRSGGSSHVEREIAGTDAVRRDGEKVKTVDRNAICCKA